MFFAPVIDFTLPNMALILGLPITIGLFILVFLVEAVVLHRLTPKAHALKDSFLMNIASTALGWNPIFLPRLVVGELPNFLIWILIGWVVSVIVEGFVLKVLERSSEARRVFAASLAVNSLSYLLLTLFTVFLPSWAFQSRVTPIDQINRWLKPGIVLEDSSISYKTIDGDRNKCAVSVYLRNDRRSDETLTGFDVEVSFQGKKVQFKSDPQGYAATNEVLSIVFSQIRAAFFKNDIKNQSQITLPVSIGVDERPILIIETSYVIDPEYEWVTPVKKGDPLSVSYTLYFASGQSLKIPREVCETYKLK